MGSPAISERSRPKAAGDADRRLAFDPETVAWRVLDDVIIVYSDRSGATHQFGEFDGWVVRQIANGPTSLRALAARADEVVDATEDEVAERLQEIARTLDALALLETAA